MENFLSTPENRENCKSLAQRIFPHLQYMPDIISITIPQHLMPAT